MGKVYEFFGKELNELTNRIIVSIKGIIISKGLTNKNINFNGHYNVEHKSRVDSIDTLSAKLYDTKNCMHYYLEEVEINVLLWVLYMLEEDEYYEVEED